MNEKKIETQDMDIIENAIVAIRDVWKKKLLIILVTVAGLLSSLIYINLTGTSIIYYSSATLFSAVYGSYNDSTAGVAVMNRYTDLLSSSRVCSRAAQSLTKYDISSDDLQRMVSSGVIRVSGASKSSTSYGYKLTVSTQYTSSAEVVSITNAVASAFAAELNELIGSSTIQVMDEATDYAAYRATNSLLYIVLFTGGAFALSCGAIFCMAFFSPWVRSVAQCEQDDELILGILPLSKEK